MKIRGWLLIFVIFGAGLSSLFYFTSSKHDFIPVKNTHTETYSSAEPPTVETEVAEDRSDKPEARKIFAEVETRIVNSDCLQRVLPQYDDRSIKLTVSKLHSYTGIEKADESMPVEFVRHFDTESGRIAVRIFKTFDEQKEKKKDEIYKYRKYKIKTGTVPALQEERAIDPGNVRSEIASLKAKEAVLEETTYLWKVSDKSQLDVQVRNGQIEYIRAIGTSLECSTDNSDSKKPASDLLPLICQCK